MANAQLTSASGSVAKWLDILRQFPELAQLGELRGFSTVYYPVALLKMRLEEYSFEDFNAVEQSLLRFYSCGITTPQSLSKWMALPSERYIQERLSLMMAEGLIANGTVTEMGRESLEMGQKKQLYDAEQMFQADGVMGLLLPRAYQIKEDHLIPRSKTTGMLPHLAPAESILVDQIRRAIQGPEKIRDYKRYRKSILNVNVHQVTDVRFADLRYIKAILAWPQHSRAPLLFLPVFKKGEDGKYQCDTPLYIPRSASYRLPKLSQECEIVEDSKLEPLTNLYNLMTADQAGQGLDSVKKWFNANTAFTCREVIRRDNSICATLDLAADAKLGPGDVEILASMGSREGAPVELEMDLVSERGQNFKKRMTVWAWPGNFPDARTEKLAARLAKDWPDVHRKYTGKNAPSLTLAELKKQFFAPEKKEEA